MQRKNRHRRVVCHALIEAVEMRQLLSITPGDYGILDHPYPASVDVSSKGICTIHGTDLADDIAIDYVRATDSTAAHYVVSVSGPKTETSSGSFGPGILSDLKGKTVVGFRIAAGGGDDTIHLNLPALGKFALLQNTMYGGGGNDRISGTTGR